MSRIEDLERRLAKDPNSKIFAQLAEEYRKAGRLEDAVNTCREGLQNHPNYFSARVALGRALLESSALEEASQEFETVLGQVPDNILANKFLGRTYHELGRLPDALAKYQIAQTLAPEDSELSGHISEVEAQIAQGPVSKPVPAPLADYDDPTAVDFEGGEKEPTIVETEPYPSPVPPQHPDVASGPGSQEAVFEFEGTEPAVSEPPAVPPSQPAPIAPSVPTEPNEVVYELEGTEPTMSEASEPPTVPPAQPVPMVPNEPTEPTEAVYEFEGRDQEPRAPAAPIQPLQSAAEAPSEPGEVLYELEGSEAIESETPKDAPPPLAHTSSGEVVYDFEDNQEALSGEPVSVPGLPSGTTDAEPIFELEGTESPSPEERELSTAARRQAEEIRATPKVSDETRAIEEEFEQSFPTGVVQRQVREIKDSARVPEPRAPSAPPEIPAESVLPSDAEPVYELEGEEVAPQPMEPEQITAEVVPPVTETGQITTEVPQSFESVSHTPVSQLPESSSEAAALVENTAEASAGVTTATLAELYASQGHLEQALEVYRELMAKEPDDKKIRQRFEELQMLTQAKAEVSREAAVPAEATSTARAHGVRETLRVLEDWLAAIKRT